MCEVKVHFPLLFQNTEEEKNELCKEGGNLVKYRQPCSKIAFLFSPQKLGGSKELRREL